VTRSPVRCEHHARSSHSAVTSAVVQLRTKLRFVRTEAAAGFSEVVLLIMGTARTVVMVVALRRRARSWILVAYVCVLILMLI
jgi:hypothetical protein